MESSNRQIALVIVNFGSANLIAQNLGTRGLESFCNVVIVDNFSSKEEVEKIEALCSKHGWTLQLNSKNLGFGEGVNEGVRVGLSAGAEILILLNPDAWMDQKNLSRLISRARQNPNEIYSPRILHPSGAIWMENTELLKNTGFAQHAKITTEPIHPEWLSGACLAMSKDSWVQLGGFYPKYFLYWEDVDLTYRFTQFGKLTVDPTITAFHSPGGTQSSDGSKSANYIHFVCRNRLLFSKRNLNVFRQILWLITSPLFLARQLRRYSTHSKKVFLSHSLAGLRGNLAGIRLMFLESGVKQKSL